MILVTGAGGLTGGELVRRLVARGVAVRALVRDPARARIAPGAELSVGDMTRPESLVDTLRGVERVMVISSSSADMVAVQTSFITAAARAGVRHIVKLSGIIPAPDSPFRFARMHAEIERHLEASGVAWTHLRAGEFMHAYFRQAPSIVARNILALPMASARIASIDIGDIAEAAARVLTSDGHERTTYPITGPEALSMEEVAALLSEATGRLIRYVDVAPDDARRAQLAAGIPSYLADGLAELFAERRAGKEATVWPTLRDKLGIEPTSFSAFAKRHAAVFRGDEPAPRL